MLQNGEGAVCWRKILKRYGFSADIWSQSREDVNEVLEYLAVGNHNFTDSMAILPTNMAQMKMMIKTRPRYPSNKLTFTIADIAKGKTISNININIDSNATFDVDLFLEDSKRNFLISFLFFFLF